MSDEVRKRTPGLADGADGPPAKRPKVVDRGDKGDGAEGVGPAPPKRRRLEDRHTNGQDPRVRREEARPWFLEARVEDSLVRELSRAFDAAPQLGTGCDPRAGASYAFLSTSGVSEACRRGVEAAVRAAAAGFELDWATHRVAPLHDEDNAVNLDAKFVRYRAGDRVPPVHLDTSLTVDGRQTVNCVLYLNDDYGGGETVLDAASPRPTVVRPRTGKLILWRSLHYRPVVVERRALHTANPVLHGEKRILALAIRARRRGGSL